MSLKRNKVAFDELSKKLHASFKLNDALNPDTALTEAIDHQYLEIDATFETKITAAEIKEKSNEFRYQHVEQLLNQAADLLDRGIRDRAEWDEKRIKAFELGLALLEFEEIDKVHDKEISEGFYTWTAKQSKFEFDAERLAGKSYEAAGQDLHNLRLRLEKQREERKLLAARKAHFEVLPWSHKQLYENWPPAKYSSDGIESAGLGGEDISWEWVKDIVRRQFDYSLDDEVMALKAQVASAAGQFIYIGSRTWAAQEKSRWNEKDGGDTGFRMQRTQIARQLADMKYKAAAEIGGPLNYLERMAPIKERFEQDFKEAIARLYVAAHGLKNLYGYVEPLPSSIDSLLSVERINEELPRRYLDDCLLWVREAISFMVGFAQAEQSYVMPLSVRAAVEQKAIDSGADAAEAWQKALDAQPIKIRIPESLFQDTITDQRHVRLRGINIFSIESEKNGIWQVTVQPPAVSYCRHLGAEGTIQGLSQGAVCVRSGRVRSRDSFTAPDVVGVSALHNFSPFGLPPEISEWHIWVSPLHSYAGVKTSKLEDIHIDLHLVVRTQ